MEKSGLDISIVICCYNSADRIKPTLKHIASQKKISKFFFEVILINNNSTDNTGAVAFEFWKELDSSIELKIFTEIEPGLAHARRRGIEEASGKYILFCDDDNWLNKYYLRNSYAILEANPKIGVLGGLGIPKIEGEKPDWFKQYSKYYATGPQAGIDGNITQSKGYVYGAGSIFRKKALQVLAEKNFQPLLSGRKGKRLISGEDNELCYAIAFLGYEIHYSEDLKFQHFIPSGRLTYNYLKRFRIGQASSYDIIRSYETILFSEGRIRRSKYARKNELRRITPELASLLIKRLQGKIDRAEYIFNYFNKLYIIKNCLSNWTYFIETEKEIFELYKKLSSHKLTK